MGGKSGKVKMSAATRRVMEAVADTIIPSDGPERPGASDVNLVDRLMEFLGQIPFACTAFKLACWSWEFCPLWTGRLARFSRLPAEDRERMLQGWETSRLMFRRSALLFTKAALMASFYNNPAIWPQLGYKEGCMAEPPLPVDQG
ncbi:MAG TPA: hypothetical protein VM658_04275 [bacterium]|nr:hypothetical protein [bacterium]